MKKELVMFAVFGIFLISCLSIVSATTFIMGTIYNSDYTMKIGDADITVACSHGDGISYNYTKSLTSGSAIGDYSVSFPETGKNACNGGDTVTVTATKGDLLGTDSEEVVDNMISTLDVAIINIPLTPEFGLVVGALTVMSAIGIFFFVRQ
jgi:hypothetical protein